MSSFDLATTALPESLKIAYRGSCRFAGLPDRLDKELKEGAGSLKTVAQVHAPDERETTAWQGGAVLANLPHFRSMWVSRTEYNEQGASIVRQKCFD